MRIFVVEDEKNVREGTLAMLEDLPAEVVGATGNIDDAFLAIKDTNPDLVILDIKLGEHTSFDLLAKFDRVPFKVLFVTAHSEYALRAFEFSAVNYLLKPLSFKALKENIEKASQAIGEASSFHLETLRYNLEAKKDQKLVLKTLDKIHVVPIQTIVRCESDTSYTIFHLTSGERIIVSKTLLYYHELLSSLGFFRVHKSHLINIAHVVKIHKAEGGDVEMSDGSMIAIAQRKKEEFLELIAKIGLS